MNTHGVEVDFGKHKGTLYTRVPVSYLQWMVNSEHSRAHIAKAELDRRGTKMPDLELSGHSIDRASRIMLKDWLFETEQTNEGFHSWLLDRAMKAWSDGSRSGEIRYYARCKWVFAEGVDYPSLKTVMRTKKETGVRR